MNNVEEVIQFIIARSFAYIKVEVMMSILTINLLLHLFHFIWLLLICLAHLVSLNIASVTYVLSIADGWIYVPRGKSDIDVWVAAFSLLVSRTCRIGESSAHLDLITQFWGIDIIQVIMKARP